MWFVELCYIFVSLNFHLHECAFVSPKLQEDVKKVFCNQEFSFQSTPLPVEWEEKLKCQIESVDARYIFWDLFATYLHKGTGILVLGGAKL